MSEERIGMSQRERDRLRVLQEVEGRHLQQVEAAARLKLSVRQVRRLQRRWRAEGDGGLVHRGRGRESKRKLPEALRSQVLEEVRRRYADFGPTLAGEKLAEQGLKLSRETLRKLMVEAGFWKPRHQRLKSVHVWRERRAAFGELVMMDSSPFCWLEERGPASQLIALIDDATSRVWARFAEADTTLNNLQTLGGWLQHYGRPVALYTDKNSLFTTSRPVQWQEQLEGQATERTQFGRALKELGIEWIPAHSPQAKGRVENLFGTLQNRLVKEMRLAGVNTMAEANRFLEEVFLPQCWEQRFLRVARQPQDAHRPLEAEHRLAEILSVREARSLASDYTVRWQGQLLALSRDQVRSGWHRARIEVEQRLDQSLWARFRGSYLSLRVCPAAQRGSASPSGLRPPGLADPRPDKSNSKTKSTYFNVPNHLWKRTFLVG
jgi:transposase